MKKYVIVESVSSASLQEKVNKNMEQGYIPTGGVAMPNQNQPYFAQAMVYQPVKKAPE